MQSLYYYFPAYFTGLTRIESKKIFLYAIKDQLGGYKCGWIIYRGRTFLSLPLGAMTDEARNQRLGAYCFTKLRSILNILDIAFYIWAGAVAANWLDAFQGGILKNTEFHITVAGEFTTSISTTRYVVQIA